MSTTSEKEYYTWDTVPWSWDEADKTWADAGKTVWTTSVDEAIGFGDGFKFRASLNKQETVKVSAREWRNIGKQNTEVLDFASSHHNSVSVSKQETFGVANSGFANAVEISKIESFSVLPTLAKGLGKSLEDAFDIDDSLSKKLAALYKDSIAFADAMYKVRKLIIQESLHIGERITNKVEITRQEQIKFVELYWDNIKFMLNIAERITLGERLSKIESVVHKEGIKLADKKIGSKISQLTKERFMVTDNLVKQMYMPKQDGFSLDDDTQKELGKCVAEQLVLADELRKKSGISLQESFNFEDLAIKIAGIVQKDSFNLADSVMKHPTIFQADGFSLTDAVTRHFQPLLQEQIKVVDVVLKEVAMTRAEQIICADTLGKSAEITQTERFMLADYLIKEAAKLNSEVLGITDSFDRKLVLQRDFAESLTIADAANKNVKLNKDEPFAVYDAYIKACEGVLSNIKVSETDMDLAAFERAVKKPPGYGEFIEFKVGEYEYQDALVRLKIQTEVNQTQPSATGVIMYVDIPDTDDRGTVTITDAAAPTKVHFNKHYYKPPEVAVTLRGGNTADGGLIPNIVSTEGIDTDGRYFEVELWNESWTQRKTGTVSWVAKGY